MGLFLPWSFVYGQNKQVVLQLKWLHQFQFAGFYAADIKGFYNQEGLDVKIKPGDKNHTALREVMSGRATFGVAGSDLLINYCNGTPVVALGAIFQHSPYIIISAAEKEIYFPSDLIGKKIMALEDQGWVQLKAMLIKEQIPLDSIHIIKHSWVNGDLVNGKADAMMGYISIEPYQLKKAGVEVNYLSPVNYDIDFYDDILFTSKSTMDKNNKETEKFRRASFKGWEYAFNHPGEIADYILTLPGVVKRGVTKDALLYEAAEMRKLVLPELVEIGHMNEGRWQDILEVHKSLNLIAKTKRLDGFIYDTDKHYVARFLRIGAYISIAVLLLILAFVFYSMSLKRAVKNRTIELEREIIKSNEIREKLYISEDRLDMATEAAEVGIWDYNITDNAVYLSDMWKLMLGYQPDELPNTSNTFISLLHPHEKNDVIHQFEEHIKGNANTCNIITRLRMKNGNYKWILSISKATLRNESGEAIRLAGIQLDVDDMKKKELELNKLSQTLMTSNKELKQFAYITSHNLRAPVANLLLLMQLFKKEELTEKNRTLYDKTVVSINQLNQTLDDLNEILSARFNETDKREEISFENVLTNVISSISEEIESSRAIITYDFYKADRILYSKKVLHSIFLNLITNSIKYHKPDTNPRLFLSTTQDKDHIILTAKDEGVGIDMEKFGHKIFGIYQRFHNIASGKGLGLYIIKNQVEALNGKIEVKSKPCEGTTFIITFNKTSIVDHE